MKRCQQAWQNLLRKERNKMSRRTILNSIIGSRDPDFTSGNDEEKTISEDLVEEDLDTDEEIDLDDLPM